MKHRKPCFLLVPIFITLTSLLFLESFEWDLYTPTVYDDRRHMFKQCSAYPHTHTHALLTLLTSTNHVKFTQVLGKSIMIYSNLPCSVQRICLVIQGTHLSQQELNTLSSVGWTILFVPEIVNIPRINASNINDIHYVQLPTKLLIFNLTQYQGVLYLDADTLVLGDLNTLFFQAIPEMAISNLNIAWVRNHGDAMGGNVFNADVLLVRPSNKLFLSIMDYLHHRSYRPAFAEQGVLNVFFLGEQFELSAKFNMHTQIPTENASLYASIRDDVRIFHSTQVKPTYHFYLLQCWWYGIYDYCREWTKINALDIHLDGAIEF